jgi:hypothetical protein
MLEVLSSIPRGKGGREGGRKERRKEGAHTEKLYFQNGKLRTSEDLSSIQATSTLTKVKKKSTLQNSRT